MHPADEYAKISAEIRRLKARQSTVRAALIENAQERRSNRHEVTVKNVTRRVFLRDKLPAHILQDGAYWEVRISPRVTVTKTSAGQGPAQQGFWPNRDEDDPILVEDF